MSDRFHHFFIAQKDFDASLMFYRDTLGGKMMSEWTDNFGKRGAQLSGGGIKVVIAEEHGAMEMRDIAAKAHAHSATLHLDIHDPNARFAQIPAGNHVVIPPEDNNRGRRWFVVKDPDGNLIAFNEMRQKS
ncbi:MAG: VOC family protein [Betaproteobacteria bacterium]|nr:VOC family protein [Betaproteobacteria bacterium]